MANDPTGGMGKLSKKTRAKVDEELKEEELALLMRTNVNLESLRPKVSDPKAFDKLIKAVMESTEINENIAQLQTRLINLGGGVLQVTKEVIKLI